MSKSRQAGLTLLVILAATAAVAALAGRISAGSSDAWYAGLNKAPFNPPDIAFAIVWPVLFVLMAAGAALVRLSAGSFERASPALGLYFTQLGVNLSWSYAFFVFHAPVIALAILLALFLLIVAMIRQFRPVSRTAALLQLPYLVWVAFAGVLNGWVAAMN